MSDEEKQVQVQASIREYAEARQDLAHLEKRLSDFRGACSMAGNVISPGALATMRETRPKGLEGLLNAGELAEVLGSYYATRDRIAELRDYLRKVGWGGLVD